MIPVTIKNFKVEKFRTENNSVKIENLISGSIISKCTLSEALSFILRSNIYKCVNLSEAVKLYQSFKKVKVETPFVTIKGIEVVNQDMLNFMLITHGIYKISFDKLKNNLNNRKKEYRDIRYLYCFILYHFFGEDFDFIAMFIGKSRPNIYNCIEQIEFDYKTNHDFRTLTEPIWDYWSTKTFLPLSIAEIRNSHLSKIKGLVNGHFKDYL